MNAKRSLPRFLLTVSLILFIICGFTVTPIVGAELTSEVSVAYCGLPEHVAVSAESVETEDIEEVDTKNTDSDDLVLGHPAFAVFAPEVAKIYIDFAPVTMSGGDLVILGDDIGIQWDGLYEDWDNFVLDVQDAINEQLHTKQWILVPKGPPGPVTDSPESADTEKVLGNPALAVWAPEVVEICIGGAVAIMSGFALVTLGNDIGMPWDGLYENWDNFVLDVQDAINEQLHIQQWIRVSSSEGQKLLSDAYNSYFSGGGSRGKKDDRCYFEGRLNEDNVLEINQNSLTENQAIHRMGQGKNIITLSQNLAKNLVKRFKGLTKEQASALKFEGDHNPANGWLHHLHYEAKCMRLHLWSWK